MNNTFFIKISKIFWECCKDFLDQSCYTLSHWKLFYNCNKLIPFKALLFPTDNLKFTTCWLQWLFKKKKNQVFQSQSLSNVDMKHTIKLTQISLSLIPVQPLLSTSSGPTFDFPPPFHIKSGQFSKRCFGFWKICTKWRLCRKKHVKCIALTHNWEVLYL